MTHDPIHGAMFWVGALFVFTPLVLASIVVGVWWWGRRRDSRSKGQETS